MCGAEARRSGAAYALGYSARFAMAERNATDILSLRLPLYAYAAPLWHGRRVLEIGCGDGGSADYLGKQGAERVVAVDLDKGRVERARARHAGPRIEFRTVADLRQLTASGERFDIVLVPEGQSVLGLPGLITALRAVLVETGHVIMAVPAADRKGRLSRDGVGYYDLADTLAAHFPVVRMLGQTPFLGFGLVEFDGSADALRVDVSLLQGGAEQPSHYVAIAGAAAPSSLGYSLVQIPFAPIEALVLGGSGGKTPVPLVTGMREIAAGGSDARGEVAERRLEEAERRARSRIEDLDTQLADVRRKLADALAQAESAVRVSRAQAEEIQELRARLRRGAEDRAAADDELAKLRRALAEADESVLTLTRRTAEEMAVVAEKMAIGLARGAPASTTPAAFAELELRARRAEEASERDRAELGLVVDRIRVADEQLRELQGKAGAIAERDDRIARLEGDKQDLVWQVAELEEKLRQAVAPGETTRGSAPEEVAIARKERDRAIEEFHRGAGVHASEVRRLQLSVAEQAALVDELEDTVKSAEARAATSDKEAATLRRNAKELEDADRARRGRLAELEGKLLRLEREREREAASHPAGSGIGGAQVLEAEFAQRLSAAEQRALAAEQRAVGAEEQMAALAKQGGGTRNGHHDGGIPPAELQAAVAGIEERLRDEMRTLAAIEESLNRAREEVARRPGGSDPLVSVRSDFEQALAAKDSQLVEGRLELARLRRDSEARQAQLEREIGDLRGRLNPTGEAGMSDDHGQTAQLILMHSTLANIRRRSARLRDELEGFRRRLDTLPPGALSSMLEEIGEDLAEFAK